MITEKIKISFDLDESDKSGKHKFMSRLKSRLVNFGFDFVPNNEECDVHLFVNAHNKYAKVNIYRIDGVWVNVEQNYEKLNNEIYRKIKLSDGVIFQNEFCKEAVKNIIGLIHENNTCILNGAPIEEFANIAPYEHNNKYFLAMCKWRPHKRLKQIIDGFLHANLKDVDLFVCGDPDIDKIKHKNIKYLGWQNKNDLNRILKGSIGTVHLAWLDWCPNSVVESLICGKQVIHTTSGGTPYVVKNRGYVITDKRWKFNPHKIYTPPEIKLDQISESYIKSLNCPIINFDVSDLNIDKISKKYADFIIKTLEKKNG